MKEKEIRNRLNEFMTAKTDSSLPYTVVAYACGFPSGVYVYAAPDSGIYKYMAPMPEESPVFPDVYQPWTIKPIPEETPSDPPKIDRSKVDKCELDELIRAVLDLKGQSVEIYKLKAVAIGIKERNENSNES